MTFLESLARLVILKRLAHRIALHATDIPGLFDLTLDGREHCDLTQTQVFSLVWGI